VVVCILTLFFRCVTVFNVARSLLAYFHPHPEVAYDIVYLISNFVLIFIEVSVIVFMSHSYMVSGREAITRYWSCFLLC
jgi:hypothetical protein